MPMEKNSGIVKRIENCVLVAVAAVGLIYLIDGCDNKNKSVMTQDETQNLSIPSLGNYNPNNFNFDKSTFDKVMEKYETKNNASTYKTGK